jgi:phage terminase large subunit-like protein
MMFSSPKADRVIQFIERYCRLPEGNAETHTKAGDRMVLIEWQKELIRTIYGTLKDNGLRQYNEVYIEIPRKNGKSGLGAALALYHLIADGEVSAQVFSLASTRKQAAILFESAKKMVMFSPELRKILVVQKNAIYYPKTFSYYQVLASEAGANHGYNPSAVFIDELHTIEDGGALYEALTTGQAARAQPMTFSLTTAGNNQNTKCYELHCYAKDLQKGVLKNDNFFYKIYGIDKDDDWKDEAVWRKANPSIGVTMSIDRLRQLFVKAQGMSSEEASFRRLYLNQWDSAPDKWIMDADWIDCGKDINIEDFKDYPCYIGMDLSARDDLTSAVALFNVDSNIYLFPYFFIGNENLSILGERHRVDYVGWQRDGHIIDTTGNTVDYEEIAEWITKKFDGFDVRTIKVDILFQGAAMTNLLTARGYNVEAGRTDWKTICEPAKKLERLIKRRYLVHNNNPVMRWNINNAKVRIDTKNNLWVDKDRGRNKVDGIYAALFGLSAMNYAEEDAGLPIAVLSGVKI